MLVLLFAVLDSCALKTATCGQLSLFKVRDFLGDISLKDGGLLFVFGDFGVEFVESFPTGGEYRCGHGRKVFKNLFSISKL